MCRVFTVYEITLDSLAIGADAKTDPVMSTAHGEQ